MISLHKGAHSLPSLFLCSHRISFNIFPAPFCAPFRSSFSIHSLAHRPGIYSKIHIFSLQTYISVESSLVVTTISQPKKEQRIASLTRLIGPPSLLGKSVSPHLTLYPPSISQVSSCSPLHCLPLPQPLVQDLLTICIYSPCHVSYLSFPKADFERWWCR